MLEVSIPVAERHYPDDFCDQKTVQRSGQDQSIELIRLGEGR